MLVIYKYPLPLPNIGEFNLEIPKWFAFISAQLQDGIPYLWVRVDKDEEVASIALHWVATGARVDKDWVYIATIQFGNEFYHLHCDVWAI